MSDSDKDMSTTDKVIQSLNKFDKLVTFLDAGLQILESNAKAIAMTNLALPTYVREGELGSKSIGE